MRLPLQELADIYMTSGRHSIAHDGARRRQTVTCNTEGRPVGSFVADAKNQMGQKVSFPSGVYAEFGGAAEAEKDMAGKRQAASVAALLSGLIALGPAMAQPVPLPTPAPPHDRSASSTSV